MLNSCVPGEAECHWQYSYCELHHAYGSVPYAVLRTSGTSLVIVVAVHTSWEPCTRTPPSRALQSNGLKLNAH